MAKEEERAGADVAGAKEEREPEVEAAEEGKDKEEEFVPAKKVSLKEQLEMDKEDESLRKWKEQLLGSLSLEKEGTSVEPEITFQSLSLLIDGRDPVELPIPKNGAAKKGGTPPHFVLREKSVWKLQFEFVVKNELVLGLTYWRKVTRLGAQVDKTKIMLGTYGPQKDPYQYETEEEETPHGMLARGKYSAKTGFTDDDGKTYLEMEYTFEIKKDW